MYFLQLWRSKDIVNITFNFVYMYQCIVKNRAGSDCGTCHLSKKYQHP